jgi:hypothetical protein
MTPEDQLNEMLRRSPELRPAVEASRRSLKWLFAWFSATGIAVLALVVSAALRIISWQVAIFFCIATFAVLMAFVGKVTFYSAKIRK